LGRIGKICESVGRSDLLTPPYQQGDRVGTHAKNEGRKKPMPIAGYLRSVSEAANHNRRAIVF
jgi:hypothetical protein